MALGAGRELEPRLAARQPDPLPRGAAHTTPADLNAAFKTCRDTTVSLVLGEKKAVDPLLASRQ